MNQHIADGFSAARAITKQHAKTFYFASHFLPSEKRPAAYAVYALCRISDDTVDAVSSSTAAVAKNLSRIQDSLNAVYDGSPLTDDLLIAFKQTVSTYAIPRLYFDELIDGMYMDLNKHTYEDFDELYRYCYKVAGVVGLIMLRIFGSNNPAAETHAVQLGVAMQLTNILRDIREDFQRGRIYLPQNELEKFGLSSDSLSSGVVDAAFKSFMQFQISRARDYYEQSAAGISMIADSRSRFVVYAMKDLYAGILSAIEKIDYDVFRTRAHVSSAGKIAAALRIFLRGAYR
jgi:phytoene synthase